MTSPIVWGAYTLPNPRRESTGEGGFDPIGSYSIGPDNDIYSTLFGFRRTITYSFHGLTQDELTTIKNAYRTYSLLPTNLTILTGETIAVICPNPLRWATFYDIHHVPWYACTLVWMVVALSPVLTPP